MKDEQSKLGAFCKAQKEGVQRSEAKNTEMFRLMQSLTDRGHPTKLLNAAQTAVRNRQGWSRV